MENNNCTCTAKICCNAWHEIRPDGALDPQIKTFVAEHPDSSLRVYRRHAPDGTPIAERMETEKLSLECGLLRYASEEETLVAMNS